MNKKVNTPLKAKDIPKVPAKQLIVGKGAVIKADVSEADLVLIEGTVEGTIDAKCIMIFNGGVVRGEAVCDEAYLAGTFIGSKLTAYEKITIKATAQIQASVSYYTISMEAGSIMSGNMVHSPQKSAPEKKSERTSIQEEWKKEGKMTDSEVNDQTNKDSPSNPAADKKVSEVSDKAQKVLKTEASSGDKKAMGPILS